MTQPSTAVAIATQDFEDAAARLEAAYEEDGRRDVAFYFVGTIDRFFGRFSQARADNGPYGVLYLEGSLGMKRRP